MERARYSSFSCWWIWLALLCACKIDIPRNYFECENDGQCPEGWSCEQGLCRDRALGAERDAGIDAAIGGNQVSAGNGGDTAQAGQRGEAGSEERAGQGGAGTQAQPLQDHAIARAGERCNEDGERACRERVGSGRLRCNAGIWRAEAVCAETSRCDSQLGAVTQGECREVPGPCRGQLPGAQVCDGKLRGVCSDNLFELEIRACEAHAHCAAEGGKSWCDCDAGYALDRSGECSVLERCEASTCAPGGSCMDQPDGYRCNCTEPGYEGTGGKACTEIDDCAGKSCGAGGTCVDGRLDYTCNCAPGFLSSSPHACTDIDECATTSLCTGTDYPCQNAAPFYACSGQFLATRMPDVTNPASQPSYTPQMDTVLDNVTHLLWQNNIPTTGSICGMGGLCTWEQARDVCDTLTLAGSSDWRLPSRVELESLLDLTRQGSAIAAPFQVATNPRPRFWTRSVYALSTKSRWYVDFLEGWSFYDPTPNTYYVRCVR